MLNAFRDGLKRTKQLRPWWWWLNPWLYIARRDSAYKTSVGIIEELGRRQQSRDRGAEVAECNAWRAADRYGLQPRSIEAARMLKMARDMAERAERACVQNGP